MSGPQQTTREWRTRKRIILDWDDEAQVLIATSPDVPGLVLQGRDVAEIMNKAKLVVPALCEEIE